MTFGGAVGRGQRAAKRGNDSLVWNARQTVCGVSFDEGVGIDFESHGQSGYDGRLSILVRVLDRLGERLAATRAGPRHAPDDLPALLRRKREEVTRKRERASTLRLRRTQLGLFVGSHRYPPSAIDGSRPWGRSRRRRAFRGSGRASRAARPGRAARSPVPAARGRSCLDRIARSDRSGRRNMRPDVRDVEHRRTGMGGPDRVRTRRGLIHGS